MDGRPALAYTAAVTSPLLAAARPRAASVALALGALYVIWGSTYLGIRVALEGFPPLLMSGTRFVVAGGLLYAALRLGGAPGPSRAQWWAAARVGPLLVGANALVSMAEVSVSSSVAAIVVASVPLWTALAARLAGERPSAGEWAGIAVGISGVVVLQSGGELQASPGGAALLVLSTWSWASGSIWARRLPLPEGLMASAAEQLCGGALILAAGLAAGERLVELPGARPLLAWAYLVVFGSLVAFSAYVWLLRHVRPALATSYAYVNPAVAVGLGALAGEAIPPRALVALVLVVAGVVVVATAARRRAR